jgi:hypothetical protein
MARKGNERYIVFNGGEYEDRQPIAVTHSLKQAKQVIDQYNDTRPGYHSAATYEYDIEEIRYYEKGQHV